MLLISVMSPTYMKKKKVDNSKGTYNEMRFGYLYDLIISSHYNDVIMSSMASQITSLTIVYSIFYQAQIKENIKAPRHWSLWREFTGDRRIPQTNGQ